MLIKTTRQTIGVKLEPAQASRDFIVIDEVARPTPN